MKVERVMFVLAAFVMAVAAVGCSDDADPDRAASSTTSDVSASTTLPAPHRPPTPDESGAVVWDYRSPIELEWEQVGSLDDWSMWPGDVPVGHQDGWVALVHGTGDDSSASVQMSPDGVEWQSAGLPEGVSPGSLTTDGEWLVAESEGSLWVSTGDGTWDEQLEGRLQASFVEAGPAGVLALGLTTDGIGGVWRLEDGTFVDTTPEGLDDIDVGSLNTVYLVVLADGYVVRMHYSGSEEATQEDTDWSSPDGIVWSESWTEGALNPGGNLLRAEALGSPEAESQGETVLVNTDSGLWRTVGPSITGLGAAVDDFPENGGGVLSASEDVFVYQSGDSFLTESEGPRTWLSKDGYRWLEIAGPPSTDPNPDIDGYGLVRRHVIDTGTELIAYDTYGQPGGFGSITNATTTVWTAPTPELHGRGP